MGSDARSGFGRIKDAVGLRGHTSRPSKDEGVDVGYFNNPNNSSSTFGVGSTGTPISPVMVGKAFTWKDTPAQYQNGAPKAEILSSGNIQREPKQNGLSKSGKFAEMSLQMIYLLLDPCTMK